MSARDVRSIVAQAGRSSARHGVTIAVAPPAPLLAIAAEAAAASAAPGASRARRGRAGRPLVLAQHTDGSDPGSTTGHIVAGAVKAAGADGSIVNHSEYRVLPRYRKGAVERLRQEGLLSVVCATTAGEAAVSAGLGPDYVAIEPPGLIGTGRAISRERPGMILKSARAVDKAASAQPKPKAGAAPAPRTRLLCGAGIATAADVRRAVDLGSAGVLVASGIVLAENRSAAIDTFAKALAAGVAALAAGGMPRSCPQCGKEPSLAAKYCVRCGAVLDE